MSDLLLRLQVKSWRCISATSEMNRKQAGFTLLELIVVILIVGLLLTFATLSVGTSADKQLETEAKRFASLMKLASEEAIMNSREMALEVNKQSYSFLVYLDNQFQPLDEEGGGVFRARELPEYIKIGAEIEEEIIDFDELEEDDELPKILVLSSGEMTPFNIKFSQDDGATYEISGDFFGRIEYVGKVKSDDF